MEHQIHWPDECKQNSCREQRPASPSRDKLTPTIALPLTNRVLEILGQFWSIPAQRWDDPNVLISSHTSCGSAVGPSVTRYQKSSLRSLQKASFSTVPEACFNQGNRGSGLRHANLVSHPAPSLSCSWEKSALEPSARPDARVSPHCSGHVLMDWRRGKGEQ